MPFSVTILGSNSSIPSPSRNSSSQLINIDGKLLLFDCAEATQIQLRKYRKKIQSVEAVFISHLHGDHYFGIMGLISTMHLLGRTQELHLFAPPGLYNIIEAHNKASNRALHFPLIFHDLTEKPDTVLLDNELYQITAFSLNHSIPSYGFCFKTKEKERKFRKDVLLNMDIHYTDIQKIKKGSDYTDRNGIVHENKDITLDPEPVTSFAYCSDTAYCEDILPYIKNVDLLYHESTFLEVDRDMAAQVLHSTARQAAEIASKANAKKLVIGHFSPRYDDVELFLNEAKEVFAETYLANDGDEYFVQG